jgi:flagellar protein FliJ
MAYHFKLEALRRYRQYEEERLQKELADAVRRRDLTAAAMDDRLEQRNETESALYQSQNQSTFSSHFCIYVRYLQGLEERIVKQRRRLSEAEKDTDRRRDNLLQAVKKRKTLDRLNEKGLKAYIAELDHEELKFINEIAINRFGSNK